MWYPCKNSWHSYRVCTEGPIWSVYPDTVEPTKMQISSKGPPWDTKGLGPRERSAIPTGNHHRGWKIPGNSMVLGKHSELIWIWGGSIALLRKGHPLGVPLWQKNAWWLSHTSENHRKVDWDHHHHHHPSHWVEHQVINETSTQSWCVFLIQCESPLFSFHNIVIYNPIIIHL
jgi:hypothetical protein